MLLFFILCAMASSWTSRPDDGRLCAHACYEVFTPVFLAGYLGLDRQGRTAEAQNRRGTSPEVPGSLRVARRAAAVRRAPNSQESPRNGPKTGPEGCIRT